MFHRMYQLTESMIQLGQESLRFQYKGARVLTHYQGIQIGSLLNVFLIYGHLEEEEEQDQEEENHCEPSTPPQTSTEQVDPSTKHHPHDNSNISQWRYSDSITE